MKFWTMLDTQITQCFLSAFTGVHKQANKYAKTGTHTLADTLSQDRCTSELEGSAALVLDN